MRKSIAVVAGAAAVLTMAACSPTTEESVPQPRVSESVVELLPQEQYAEFAAETKEQVAAADKGLDVKELPARVTGPLLKYREAEYTLKKSIGDDFELDSIVIDEEAYPVISGTRFPRTLMTVTGPADGENLSTLSVWTQEGARTFYKLWSDIELFPGVKIPGLVTARTDTEGHQESDPADYAVAPNQVVSAYATYLYEGEMGDITFNEDDPLKAETARQRQGLDTTLGDLGTIAMSAKPTENGVQAVSTEDGGLVLTGEIIYNFTIRKSESEATLRLGGDIGAWLNPEDEDKTVEVNDRTAFNYRTTVAFYIPPADAEDKTVEVIGSSVPVLSSASNN